MRFLQYVVVSLFWINGGSSELRLNDDGANEGECLGESFEPTWSPLNYSIILKSLNPINKTFRGEVFIVGITNIHSKFIQLHSDHLTIHNCTLRERHGLYDTKPRNRRLNQQLASNGVLTLNLTRPIDEQTHFDVHIIYEGVFNDSYGLVMENYSSDGWIIFTYLEPTYARQVFPCLDIPRYKATFKISVEKPSPHLTVLSNMPPESTDGSHVVTFKTTPQMSTYLVSIMVSDYVAVKSQKASPRDPDISFWVPKQWRTSYVAKYVAFITPLILSQIEKYIGSKYSLPKLDQYVVPEISVGAMENWGLIMYKEGSILRKDEVYQEKEVIFTIAHELSHTWFGNMVTVPNWCNMWYQEAIPTFLHGLISSQVKNSIPSSGHSVHDDAQDDNDALLSNELERFVNDLDSFGSTSTHHQHKPFEQYKFYSTDMVNQVKWLARTEVMDQECTFYDNSVALRENDAEASTFSAVHYFKGAALLYMIEAYVTPQVLRESLQQIVQQHEESTMTEEDLWDSIQRSVNKAKHNRTYRHLPDGSSIETLTKEWVHQKGHPIVQLARDEGSGQIYAMQSICSLTEPEDRARWWIPIWYTRSTKPNFNVSQPQVWLKPSDDDDYQDLGITLKSNEWIVMNIQNTGFYRVNYDNTTWKLLADQLKTRHEVIAPVNRAILIDDCFKLAYSLEVKHPVCFELIRYLEYESSAYVWQAAYDNIIFLYSNLPKEEKQLFKMYLLSLLNGVFSDVTADWDKHLSDLTNIELRTLRSPVFKLAVELEYEPCMIFSVNQAMQLVNGRLIQKSIPSEVRQHLMCAAIRKGSDPVYWYTMSTFKKESDPKLKAQILDNLLCSRNHTKDLLKLISNQGNAADSIMNFMATHWRDECLEILEFFEDNFNEVVPDNQTLSLFEPYVMKTPPHCAEKTNEIFKIVTKDPAESNDWQDIFGRDALEWLQQYVSDGFVTL